MLPETFFTHIYIYIIECIVRYTIVDHGQEKFKSHPFRLLTPGKSGLFSSIPFGSRLCVSTKLILFSLLFSHLKSGRDKFKLPALKLMSHTPGQPRAHLEKVKVRLASCLLDLTAELGELGNLIPKLGQVLILLLCHLGDSSSLQRARSRPSCSTRKAHQSLELSPYLLLLSCHLLLAQEK